MRLAVLLAVFALPLALRAQSDDALAATLPSGKVVHFQSEDQKAAFLAARARSAPGTATPAPASAPAGRQPAPAALGTTALDEKPAMSGKVNVGAPIFTASYYLLAPETWVGKEITLSVAYLTPVNTGPRPDGMRPFRANTYGAYEAGRGHRHGGYMTVLATAAAAERILPLAGSTYQYTGAGMRTTLIKGRLELVSLGDGGPKTYGIIVTQ